MRLALLYRIAIPLLLTLMSATVFFRALLLLVLAIAFAGLLLLVSRLAKNITEKAGQSNKEGKEGKGFIESSYKIVEENEESSK